MTELPHLVSATLGDQAYLAVRTAIISGQIARGEKVTERGLAERLNISPTPVREALRRLEQDRLVLREGPRSVRVTDFAADELRSITMIEDTLRALAARLAAERATAEELEAMRVPLERAEELSALLIDGGPIDTVSDVQAALKQFHAAVDRAAGSGTLAHMLTMVDAFNYEERRRAVADQIAVDPDRVAERFRQHRQIFEAIVARDADEAERLMRLHSRVSNDLRMSSRVPVQDA